MNNTVIGTLSIPNTKPMYIGYAAAQDRIYMDDSAQEIINQISRGNSVLYIELTNCDN